MGGGYPPAGRWCHVVNDCCTEAMSMQLIYIVFQLLTLIALAADINLMSFF